MFTIPYGKRCILYFAEFRIGIICAISDLCFAKYRQKFCIYSRHHWEWQFEAKMMDGNRRRQQRWRGHFSAKIMDDEDGCKDDNEENDKDDERQIHSDTFRSPIWESWTKNDTFRSAIWKVCKNWYVQISVLSTPGCVGVLPWGRHVSVVVWAPISALTTVYTYRHSRWFTDNLNPYSTSRVTCSQPNLQTRISWLQYITNVTPLIWVSIYHHVTIKYTNHNPKPKPSPNHKP